MKTMREVMADLNQLARENPSALNEPVTIHIDVTLAGGNLQAWASIAEILYDNNCDVSGVVFSADGGEFLES